jgi:hypothetical protein
MKVSVLLVENAKQIMLTPENDHERSALKIIAPGDKIEAATKWGSMYDREAVKMARYSVDECAGGYFRAFPDDESLMFIVTSKKKNEEDE